jgi:hypothetical protein
MWSALTLAMKHVSLAVQPTFGTRSTSAESDMDIEPLVEPWTLAFPYTRSTGATLGRFFAGLAQERILGRRATDGRVFVPPLEHDPRSGEPLGDWVEVSPLGTVEAHTWIAEPLPTHPREAPFAFAMIRLDGADTPLLHVVDAPAREAVFAGLRVRARWAEQRTGHMRDLAGFVAATDEIFTPKGEDLPELASRSFVYPMALHYEVRAGHALSAHLRALAEARFLGRRCPNCARVYVPPLGACTVCSVAVTEDVELPETGTVLTFCIVNLAVRGQEHLERPFACGNVLLDGADTPFLVLLSGCTVRDVRAGLRVRAVWREPAERGPSLASLRHFAPSGEPDADVSVLIERRKESHRA